MGRSHAEGHIRNYRDNFPLQTVEKQLEFALVFCDVEINTVNSVFHFLISHFSAADFL